MADGKKVRLKFVERNTLCDLLKLYRDRIHRERLHFGALLPLLRAEMPGVELTESHIRYAARELEIEVPRQRKRNRQETNEVAVSVNALAARMDKLEEMVRALAARAERSTGGL